MAEVVLFHHVQGLTPGVLALAEQLRSAGHVVHTPDLFGGALPATIDDGIAFVRSQDEQLFDDRVAAAVDGLPDGLVFAGISFGAAYAQQLAVRRPGALGAVLLEACLPLTGDWGVGPWPDGVAVQVHGKDADPFFALEGDLDAARELVSTLGAQRAELFTYPGDQHLFVDSSSPSYDETAAALVVERVLAFLDGL